MGCLIQFKCHGDACQSQRVTQRNQVTRFLGGLDAGNACDAQHVPFFGRSVLNQCKRGRQHADASPRHTHAVRVGLVGHIDHMGLALAVKVCEGRHGQIHWGLT